MICPPATLLDRAREVLTGSIVKLGAQDCHPKSMGAHTGDISAEMLADAGAEAVIVGHSERRTDHGETRRPGRGQGRGRPPRGAHRHRLRRRDAGCSAGRERRLPSSAASSRDPLPSSANASNTVIAYEPVWAIGTGLTPTAADIAEVHGFIRERLDETAWRRRRAKSASSMAARSSPGTRPRILAIPNVNGALVGGASLKATDFYGILSAYRGNRR